MSLKNRFAAVLIGFGVIGATSSTSADARRYDGCRSCGTVRGVERVYGEEDRHIGAGTVIGVIAGAALGNQIGKGDGRKAATIGGAIAGGAIGHKVEKNNRNGRDYYRVEVRMDDGDYRTVTQRHNPNVRRGDYVQIRDSKVYLVRW